MNNEDENFYWCEIPFNLLVVGMTEIGKSYFILDLLEKEFKNKFHNVVIFCPTIEFNKTYQKRPFIEKDKNLYIYPPNKVEEDLNFCLEDTINEFKSQESQTLFILDDIANLWQAKNKATRLTELAFSGRHVGISVWLLTQKYNAICKDFRENCKHHIVFTCNDQLSIDQIFKENRCIPVSEKDAVLKHLDVGKKLITRRKLPWSYSLEA